MTIIDKIKLRKALRLLKQYNFEKADLILKELVDRNSQNDSLLFRYAVTQNSLGNKEVASQYLERCLELNPYNADAKCIYPTVLLELADIYKTTKKLKLLKDKFLKVSDWGFENVGYDICLIYKILSEIELQDDNFELAIDYLEQAKELYKKDDYLNETKVLSGEIDQLIEKIKK